MDKQAAINLITDTFNSSFDENRFRHFIRNLFNGFNEYKNASWITGYIKDSFKDHVKKYKRIGKYKDIDGNKMDVVVVHLRKESALERARTMQRNFIASYLKTRGEKEAAVVAYFTDNTDDWRFSYVRMEYRQKITESGKIKVKEEFTSRRYSFLVGKNEPNHTAQQQLLPILQSDSSGPTLKEIEKAFDIETVTKEFFLKYRELFLHTKEELDRVVKKDPKIKADFEAKGVDTVNFAKKLLGQIIFLYFLQKKGWFGVGRDNNWGTGSKHFLRELFEKKHADYNNFFNDILEPLFYEALRTGEDRKHEDYYYSRFNCKIPFLNGGLFDPIGNYDWVKTDIIIPDKLFSNNVKTKEDDTGTGILDVFDCYNFTVKEDEPLEKEVAIDPELLGKSYEKFNAIRPDNYDEFKKALKSGKTGEENKFNKKFGVYYTPREIVHYMCQQSLINYLDTALNTHKKTLVSKPAVQKRLFGPQAHEQLSLSSGSIPKEDIEALIHLGEQVSENEAIFLKKEQKIKKGEQKTTSIKLKLPVSIRKNAKQIDDKLAEITVCDPAVGSGAFPVGMMSEIVKARNVLSVFLNDKDLAAYNVQAGRTTYDFKRRCIEHSLYGVDIDPGAVEIAKLRLWLSLVVDEEDIKNIKPLPNLDYKIMQGNSLIELLSTESLVSSIDQRRTELVKKLKKAKDELFNITMPTQKENKRREIDILMKKLFEYDRDKQIKRLKDHILAVKSQQRLFEDDKDKKEDEKKIRKIKSRIEEIKNIDVPGPTEYFEWHVNYSEIFQAKGGFDVVIANPPYLKERDNKKVFESVNNSDFGKKYHQGKMDYWYYFLHKAIDVVRKTGTISYITSRYWLNSSGAKKLIQRVKDELSFIHFIDIGKLKVFDEVAGHHMVAVYQMQMKEQFIYKQLVNDLSDIYSDIDTENVQIKYFSNKDVFSDNNEILLEKPKYSKSNIVNLGDITDASIGVQESPDKLTYKQVNTSSKKGYEVGDGVFVLSKNEIMKLNLNQKEQLVLKKYLDPNDVDKYLINYKDKYLIYSDKKLKEKIKRDKQYLNLKKHLDRFKIFITSSNKPYGLHRPREQKYFEKPKIIFKNMFVNVGFSFDDEGKYYFGFSFSSIIQKNEKYDLKYILAILNSKFAENWFYNNGKKRGAGVDIGVQKLRQFPIKNIDNNKQKPFIKLVNTILTTTESEDYTENPQKQAKVKALEEEIDQLVYELYDLTPQEIKIVEGKDENRNRRN